MYTHIDQGNKKKQKQKQKQKQNKEKRSKQSIRLALNLSLQTNIYLVALGGKCQSLLVLNSNIFQIDHHLWFLNI